MGILHPDSSYGRLCIYTNKTDIIMLIRELTEHLYKDKSVKNEGLGDYYRPYRQISGDEYVQLAAKMISSGDNPNRVMQILHHEFGIRDLETKAEIVQRAIDILNNFYSRDWDLDNDGDIDQDDVETATKDIDYSKIDYSKSKPDILQQMDPYPEKQKRPKEKPLPPGSIKGFQTSNKPLPHKSQAGKNMATRGPVRKPRGDNNPQHAAGIDPVDSNIDILAMQQQGMSPREIEIYLQDTLGITRTQAINLIRQSS